MLRALFGKPRWEKPAQALYTAIIEQSRQPAFYQQWEVADTLDGRFDLLTLHAILVMHRLKDQGDAAKALSQALFDLMFADLDQNLREMGVTDFAVAPRIKKMVMAFYGRLRSYGDALDQPLAAGAVDPLIDGLARNLYRSDGAAVAAPIVAGLAAYVRGQAAALTAQPLADLLKGQVRFGEVPSP